MAKVHTGRLKVLSTYRSYHGATLGSISITGEARRHDSEPGMPGAVKFFGSWPRADALAHDARAHADERWRLADDWVASLRRDIASQ